MSSNATVLLARRSMRARIGRLIAISIAIILGVAFVVGSFVLADSMRSGFDSLFSDAFDNTDLQVRTELAFGRQSDSGTRDPVPADLVDTVAAVPGVERAAGELQRSAQIIDPDGEAITTGGAPMFGASWDGTDPGSTIELREGDAPSGPDQVAIDKNTAEHNDLEIGDPIGVITATGVHSFTLTGTVGVGDSETFGGATFALWDPQTAAEVLGAEGVYDSIDIRVTEGADVPAVQQQIADVLPDNTEVVDQETLIDEANDSVNQFIGPFGSGLLIFAVITAFVSAFLINSVFAVTIGHRLRELALLRAVGGAGSQVRRLIVVEALVLSVIATVVGIFAGIGVAKLILWIFNAAGAGFPDFPIVLTPLAIVMAFLVGVGITVLAVLVPAWRAARIPPVAAMHPELGFESLSAGRLVGATVVMVIGALLFVVGLLAKPGGGTLGLIALAGGGAFLLFLGTASVSSTVARPVTKLLGWPVAKAYKAPGLLASENAGRAPRRTSATVAALMVGVALVSAAAVFASSLRNTFTAAMDRGVTADWVVSGSGFQLLPGVVGDTLEDVPELSAVTGVRSVPVVVDSDEKQVAVADAVALEELIDVNLQSGSWEALQDGGIFVHQDPARDLGLEAGSTVDATFQNGVERQLTVAGIFSDAYLIGNWLLSSALVDEVVTGEQTDFFVAMKTADEVSDAEARQAIETALVDYPQTKLETADEFKDSQAEQIDQLLVVITVLLAFAIIIAVLGISIILGLAVYERTREIGLMRAVGMTRRQTRRMIRWEAIIVSVFGALVGIVLGTSIGIVLSYAVPDTIIDEISFSVSTIIAILIGAVIAGVIAALYPSFKASRMDVLEAIATE